MRPEIHNIVFAMTLLTVVHAPLAHATSEFILLPKARVIFQPVKPSDDHDNKKNGIGASLFYTYDNGKLRLLSELVLRSDEEAHELERLQAGWRVQPQATLWLGLYHNPLIHWRTLFHHGAYLQTAITRPAIAEFEDEGGALQADLAGALLEGAAPIGAGELGYALAAGAGSELGTHAKLEPVDLLNPHGKHRLNTSMRLAYRPNAVDENKEIGILLSRSNIFSEIFPAQDTQQTVGGAYFHWEWKGLRLLSAAYWVRNVQDFSAQQSSDSFGNGYAQLEYETERNVAFYGRTEGTRGGDGDAYLGIFPDFALRRNLLGIRYDFMHRQAIKLEIANAQFKDGHQHAIMMQWSGGFLFP